MDYYDRFKTLEDDIDYELLAFLSLITLEWNTTISLINRVLDKYYKRYAVNDILSFKEMRKYLTLSELKEFNRITGMKRFRISRLDALELLVRLYYNELLKIEINTMKNLTAMLPTFIVNELCDIFDLPLDTFDLEKILSSTWGDDDLNWEERLSIHGEKTANVLGRNIKDAVMNNRDYNWLTEKLNKTLASANKWSQSEIENETAYFNAALHYLAYKKAGVKNYVYHARDDHDTCKICLDLNGTTFPIAAYEIGVTAPLMHNHCRCWTSPI